MPEYVFHSGCLGCRQQEQHGVDFCYDCRYFEPDWSKPSLFKSGVTSVDKVREEVKHRRQDAVASARNEAMRILRDPIKRREFLIVLCQEQLFDSTRTWVSYEEAAQVYDDLLREQKLRKAQ